MAYDQINADLIQENRNLSARVAELEAALRPFAKEWAEWRGDPGDEVHPIIKASTLEGNNFAAFTVGDLKRAAALLSGNKS